MYRQSRLIIVKVLVGGKPCKPDLRAQRQMRVWHLAKSTPNARMAFSGIENPSTKEKSIHAKNFTYPF